MKKGIVFLILCLVCVCIAVPVVAVFNGVIEGEEELIEKAREEIPIAESDTIALQIAGKAVEGDAELIWFKSGNEYQYNRYTPIEFTALGDDKYRFVKTYKPIERGENIWVQYWYDNFVVLVDNPDCERMEIQYADGTEEVIPVEEVPFVYSTRYFSGEYIFLDGEGNPLS